MTGRFPTECAGCKGTTFTWKRRDKSKANEIPPSLTCTKCKRVIFTEKNDN